MPDVVYCVVRETWDGPELDKIFKREEDALMHRDALNDANDTNDFDVQEWIVN